MKNLIINSYFTRFYAYSAYNIVIVRHIENDSTTIQWTLCADSMLENAKHLSIPFQKYIIWGLKTMPRICMTLTHLVYKGKNNVNQNGI